MTSRTPIEQWASGTTNKETPSSAEIAAGHLNSSEANSSWVNERSGVRDIGINAAQAAAQAASTWVPSSGATDEAASSSDRSRFAGQLNHSDQYSLGNPDSDLCRLNLDRGVVAACSGWNYDVDEGCILYAGGIGSIQRVNSYRVGALVEETLDLDMPYAESRYDLACDGEYLYMAYMDSNTDTYHIAQLSLKNWTGLAVVDQDTGWTRPFQSSGYIRIAIARPGVVGAYYDLSRSSGSFGVWKVGTSWVTGAGNVATMPGSYENDETKFAEVQCNYHSVFTTVRTDNNGGAVYLINCDVDNPATSTAGPSTAKILKGSADPSPGNNTAFRVFSGKVVYIGAEDSVDASAVHMYYDDGSAEWEYRTLGYLPKNRSFYGHSTRIFLDGNGLLWVLYRVRNTHTYDGSTPLVAAGFDPSFLSPDSCELEWPDHRVAVPLGSHDESPASIQWLLSDGRNLVVVERLYPAESSVVRVITGPGVR